MFYEQNAEKREKLVPHLSHTQEREHGKEKAWTGKMEREKWEKWEREMLGATGYLSCRNGVSYEKTSVNFLSDLQQSLTQSSHSVSLWSCCLTESCHCTQAPLHCSAVPTLQHFPLKSDMTGPLQAARRKFGCMFKGQTQTDLGHERRERSRSQQQPEHRVWQHDWAAESCQCRVTGEASFKIDHKVASLIKFTYFNQ